MSILQVNLGLYANDGTGDDLRTAFEKANANFTDIDLTRVISADNLGTGAGIFKEKVGNNLKLRTIKQGLNITVTQNANDITIATPDSINNLIEDTAPTLGGNLNLNGYNVVGLGNVDIEGNVLANNFVGTLNGNIYVEDTGISITAVNYDTSDYEPISLNAIAINGNNSLVPGITYISTLPGDSLGILSEVDLELTAVSGEIRLVGNVISEDNITATTFIGGVIGNVNGTVSRINNHNLRGLGDVNDALPSIGQVLTWNGTFWVPDTIPGTGPNTEDYDFGQIGVAVTSPLQLLLQSAPVDFGTFTAPSSVLLDLGRFITDSNPFYSLSRSSASVVEGQSVSITLTTVNVEDDTLVPYTITGVTSGDIEGMSLTGTFTITDNTASLVISTTADLIEETAEILTLTLDDVPDVYVSVTILDSISTVDGGNPATPAFDIISDGGSPSTTTFDSIYDGGTPD
jgi:hypothetical protein